MAWLNKDFIHINKATAFLKSKWTPVTRWLPDIYSSCASLLTFFLDKKSNKKNKANPFFVCHLFSLKEKVAPKVQADFDAEIALG